MHLEKVVPSRLIEAHAKKQVWANESYARGLQANWSGFHEIYVYRRRIGATPDHRADMTPERLEDLRLTRSLAVGYSMLAVDFLEGISEYGETPDGSQIRLLFPARDGPDSIDRLVQSARRALLLSHADLGNYHEYLPHLRTYVSAKDPEGKDRPDQEYPAYKYLARGYHYLETMERIRLSGPGRLAEYRAEKHRNIERGLRLFYKNDAEFRFAWQVLTGEPYKAP